MRKYLKRISIVLVITVPSFILAAPRPLPLRWQPGVALYQGSASHTLETSYGTNLLTLPFSGTVTYDFYSPPLAGSTALTKLDQGGGQVFMQNVSSSTANNFKMTAAIRFYDYNPQTGGEILIVDTGASPGKDINAGQAVNWGLPPVILQKNITVPAGHLLHAAVTLALVSGNPAGFGQFLYNGPSTNSSVAYLSEDTAASWSFASVPSFQPGQTNSIQMLPNGSAQLTCAGYPNQTYLVQATPNLTSPSWTTIGSNTAGLDGLFVFIDVDAPLFPVRFYRTSTP
jgi:hypothetical protein